MQFFLTLDDAEKELITRRPYLQKALKDIGFLEETASINNWIEWMRCLILSIVIILFLFLH